MPQESVPEETFVIDVSQDNMKAMLKFRGGRKLGVEEVLEALDAKGITFGIRDPARIKTFLDDPGSFEDLLIVAVGKPVQKGRNAEIEFLFETVEKSEYGLETHKENSDIYVEEGAVLATRQPPERGSDGMTVFGASLPGEWGVDLRLSVGRNVIVSEDGCKYVSAITGVPTVHEYELRVEPLKMIEGDLVEDLDFPGILHVRGAINGAKIRAEGNLVVDGGIKQAEIETGANLKVAKGIEAGSRIRAEGSVSARYITGSEMYVDNNLVVTESVSDSTIECNGNVFCDSFSGGSLMAMDWVTVKSIGSPRGTPTRVQVGYHCEMHGQYLKGVSKYQELQRNIRELQKEHSSQVGEQAESERQHLQTRMAEAVRQLKDLESELASVRKKRKFNSLLSLKASETIYPGTKIFIGDVYYSVSANASGGVEIKWDINRKKPFITGESGDLGTANTILIVDDSPDIRNALRMMSEGVGLEVIAEAEDGVECVALYKKHRPTLVTCDIAMVNMDGLEALREIRAFDPDARVIMISSITDDEKIMECMMSGALDYIKKPMLPNKVITVIRSALG